MTKQLPRQYDALDSAMAVRKYGVMSQRTSIKIQATTWQAKQVDATKLAPAYASLTAIKLSSIRYRAAIRVRQRAPMSSRARCSHRRVSRPVPASRATSDPDGEPPSSGAAQPTAIEVTP